MLIHSKGIGMTALVTTMLWTCMWLKIGKKRLNSRYRIKGSPPTIDRCKGRCILTRRTIRLSKSSPKKSSVVQPRFSKPLPKQALQGPATVADLDDVFGQGLQMFDHFTRTVVDS